ncbi:MAG: enoyl-CoA hydratase-related protein [Chloroflexota bacterium]|nr:enoyl-CoA hydratase-related protein [Chloroflexota bacterium]MDE2958510.1 enoyl-CoA hydratase-related protein [Chloroflexota bacterium]
MPDYELILYEAERDSSITRITLNRPDRLNALNDQMQVEIADAVARADADPDTRVVIITGAGRAFCAGGDMNQLGGSSNGNGSGWTSGNADQVRRSFKLAQDMILGVQRCEKPVIAMVNGVATGAGLDLACACDIRTGTPRSRFMSAYVRIGLFPGFGGTWLYPRTMGSLGRAAEMLFTGDFLEAEDAYRLGFLNRLVAEDELEEATLAIAERIAAGPPIAIRLSKLMLYKGLEFDLETAMKMAAAGETITLTSQDHVEGVEAFRQKRAAEYRDS